MTITLSHRRTAVRLLQVARDPLAAGEGPQAHAYGAGHGQGAAAELEGLWTLEGASRTEVLRKLPKGVDVSRTRRGSPIAHASNFSGVSITSASAAAMLGATEGAMPARTSDPLGLARPSPAEPRGCRDTGSSRPP